MTESTDIAPFLGKIRIFQGLPAQQLEALAKIAILQSYQRGETIFTEGDPPKGFFVVQSGKVKVFKTAVSGKEQILRFFEAKEHFAEVPAFDGKPFPASASAVEDSELVFFPRSPFLELLHSQPTLAVNLLAIFARHLRHFTWLIEDLSLREVPSRLAGYLLQLSHQQATPDRAVLDVTKTQLAALLGTIPETLSRGFSKLSREGLIVSQGNVIQLCDREGLAQQAGELPNNRHLQ